MLFKIYVPKTLGTLSCNVPVTLFCRWWMTEDEIIMITDSDSIQRGFVEFMGVILASKYELIMLSLSKQTSISCQLSCFRLYIWWESTLSVSTRVFTGGLLCQVLLEQNPRAPSSAPALIYVYLRVCHRHIAMEIISLPLSKSVVQAANLADCFSSLQTSAVKHWLFMFWWGCHITHAAYRHT